MNNIKKFEDFLDRMKGLLDNAKKQGHIIVRVEDLENTFPELRESEDERIRKAIIEFFELQDDNTTYSLVPKKDILAWLEKQGDKSVNIDIESMVSSYKQRLKSQGGIENSPLVNMCLTAFRHGVENTLEELNLKKLEKQGEQTYADKVEPKFREGEWITNGDYTWKIVEVKPLDYILQSQDGNIVDDTISHVDEQFNSFTIEDAKDGDVLMWDNGRYIILFKEIKDNIVAHCSYNTHSKHFGFSSNYDTRFDCMLNFRPATKEQRDTLMKAMTDAGYTFDFEKKELKKIEQKSADKFEPKFKAGDKVLVDGKIYTIKLVNEDNYIVDENGRDVQEHFSYTKDWKLVEQKPTLSEEDEKNRRPLKDSEIKVGDIITYFKNGKKGIMLVSSFDSGTYPRCKWGISHICGTAYGNWAPGFGPYYAATEKEKQQLYDTMPKEVKDWLKSLKDRLQSQPKQEWKQENTGDLTDFENAMMHIGGSFFGQHAGLDPNDTNAIKEQAKLLLELVPRQEWSEEDDDMCYKATAVINRLCADGKEYVWSISTLNKLFYWLKSLKNRVQPEKEWSEKDEEMIEHLINLEKVNLKVNHYPDLEVNKKVDELKIFFKSLTHKQWKPTKEQLETFDYYLDADISNKDKEILFGLYNDLKQL